MNDFLQSPSYFILITNIIKQPKNMYAARHHNENSSEDIT
jgi:hypothetical protein